MDGASALPTWDEIKKQADYRALVIGNGASINIWPQFAYSSLFDQATLQTDASDLFDRLDSKNFEFVLGRLVEAREVLEAVQRGTTWIDPLYEEVRTALFEAVGSVHVPYERLQEKVKTEYATAMNDCSSVFVLNYDLVAYWSHMACLTETKMVDFMFDGEHFDPANTDVWGGYTEVFYPHGGLHLWQDVRTGVAGKYRYGSENILVQAEAGLSASGTRAPLLVSGGNATEKMSLIQQSALLTFAYQRLVSNTTPTVVLGASLQETDSHIARAIAANMAGSHVAIGVHVGSLDADGLQAECERYRIALRVGNGERVARKDIHFFDSSTHPLGSPSMRC